MSYKKGDVVLLISICLFPRSSFDAFVKSRHSGENRSPDGLQLLEKTGFRFSPE